MKDTWWTRRHISPVLWGEEAQEKFVSGHDMESVLGSIGRRILDSGFGLLESKLTLIECPDVSLKHVGA